MYLKYMYDKVTSTQASTQKKKERKKMVMARYIPRAKLLS